MSVARLVHNINAKYLMAASVGVLQVNLVSGKARVVRIRNRRTGKWIELPDGPIILPYSFIGLEILKAQMEMYDNKEPEARRREWGPDYDNCKSQEKIW